ncbi:MAG: cyclohexanecarboxyl-CoA dehydrogenase [Rhodospirillaceae bacterium]|jgi:cyclohexanecarboxyl-CoA dehydrogenase|nr:cyclohexanecarboxyl-CoA dehydrogenase [Rhodospirillaceae bacterium]MBT5195698.1 cyclohexanecarboxyl-CoA dehydrogenase [Rhodospirillaceae bacterium]MBT5895281.1 cyclohexanecarboxyl-CoA dehydrogenase [Rhodospirillaceae bacterium]MBT6428693.1 cyclohexanecarboxyl-CoA dehydrogenase [Rhodospirillaceae bacterium]MBT7759785.1 cyclohexanecarboxyl-CoA dehydrogenase [Rhodospirillaceae bacterium]
MDFGFSDEQQAIRDTARRFATDRLAPNYRQREQSGKIGKDIVKEMGELGLIGTDLPTEFGGLGLDCVTTGIVIEEIAAADLNVSYVQLIGSLNGRILTDHATPEFAAKAIGEMCAGNSISALGLTEPRGGSDAAGLILRARKDGDDYILNGEKTSISLSTQADTVLLFARTGGEEERSRGVSTFYVPLDAPGVTRTEFDDMGHGAVGRGSLFFDDVRIPGDCLLGEEGAGFRQVMHGFDFSRALIGLMVLGPARQSLAEAWQYSTEREAFGNPIAAYQGVTQPLAECETYLEAATTLCYKTLWLRDQGLPHTKEAAMVKWWAPKAAFDIIHQCLLTHGHYGYTKELPLEQRMRDVLGLQIGDGTAQIQKMVIAREIVGRVALPY